MTALEALNNLVADHVRRFYLAYNTEEMSEIWTVIRSLHTEWEAPAKAGEVE